MEARPLKKIPIYIFMGVILGLSLTLVPLVTIKAENACTAMPESIQERLRALEGTYGLGVVTYSTSDVEILAISFVIALAAYLLVKHILHQHI